MNRREFVKTCAALGVTVGIPSAIYTGCKAAEPPDSNITVVSDTHAGSPPGRIYFVPGDADTIGEVLQLVSFDGRCGVVVECSLDMDWGAGVAPTEPGAIRDLERWGE